MKNIILIAVLALSTVFGASAQTLIQNTNDENKVRSIGEDVKFKVELTEFAQSEKTNITYQWFGSVLPFGFFQPLTDQTNRVLRIDSVTTNDPAYFFVIVRDGTRTEFSPGIKSLTVTQNGDLIVKVWSPDGLYPTVTLLGQPTVLSVETVKKHPKDVTFQWYRVDGAGNSTLIPGATNKDYIIPSTQISDVSFYTVIATDGCTTEQPPELYDLEVEVVN